MVPTNFRFGFAIVLSAQKNHIGLRVWGLGLGYYPKNDIGG